MSFQYNDGGRAAAGFKGNARDCVARAIAIAAEKPYAEVYEALASLQKGRTGIRSARNGVNTKTRPFADYMTTLGFVWTPTMQIGSGCKVHLRSDELPGGRIIVSVTKHYCAVIDGVIHDTHDPSRGGTRCVYGYWSKA